MLANTMRGLATEFGLTTPKGIQNVDNLMTQVDEDDPYPRKRAKRVRNYTTTSVLQICASRHLKRRSSITRGTMRQRVA